MFLHHIMWYHFVTSDSVVPSLQVASAKVTSMLKRESTVIHFQIFFKIVWMIVTDDE